ncbi:MAG: threonine synthase [Bacteroidetes bacterium]|nr:MAG: threonine synthase [Bacteroidota bacterium]
MGYVRCLRGLGSGRIYPSDAIMNLCPEDGRPVEIVLDLERLRAEQPGTAWLRPERRDLWRFGALLPLDVADPDDARHVVALGEGGTPVYDWDDHPLARQVGFRLQVKDEGAPGHNPTRSFKDRGMAMVVSMARRLGLKKLVVPTQGNAGDALATYGVAAGLEVAVVLPEDTDVPIRERVAALARQHPNVHFELVPGTIREAGALVREVYLPRGFFNVATFQEPGWRIEGKKTMGLELAEPPPGEATWRVPDVIVYPTGGGTGILGMWKAFDELEALGLIDTRRPRIVAVQSAATAPVVAAFRAGAADVTPVEPGHTVATGLNVAGGVGHFRVLEILRESGGTAIAVAEEDLRAALRAVVSAKGWAVCPESAACLAALPPLVDEGVIGPGDRVVVFNTASLDKYRPELRAAIDR